MSDLTDSIMAFFWGRAPGDPPQGINMLEYARVADLIATRDTLIATRAALVNTNRMLLELQARVNAQALAIADLERATARKTEQSQ